MILFVDDEPRIMDSYKFHLEFNLQAIGKELHFFSKVDEAMGFYKNNFSELELIILDVMMPGGETFDFKETNGGIRTGFLFYKKIREDLPKIPIFIFTNSIEEEIKSEIEKDPHAELMQKINYSLDDFWREVKEVL